MDSAYRSPVPNPPRDDIELNRHDNHIEVRFTGEFSPAAAMQVVDIMVAACVEAECFNVLLDCRPMTGPLSVVDRFEVAEYGAQVIDRHIEVAMLVRPDQTLPDRFFENVAVSRGVRVKVFTEPDEAVGWLSKRG